MEYVYASMLLHSAGQEINEANVKKVLDAAGVKADDGRVKALIASLKDVNIEEAIKSAAVPVAAAAPTAPAAGGAKKEEKKEEEDGAKAEESAAAGLGALFG
ncbi:MAG: 50S ribosomal protein P1 [Candidatus Diapherotrites archaeon]|nr:50S ribosomal protein P1 [Candidatus Diapherotrites archaeon]